MTTTLDPTQVAALIGPIDAQARTGGGLAALQSWATNLTTSGDFGQSLPLVGRSLGQLVDLGSEFSTQILTPAASYLAGPNPTAEGLLATIKAAQAARGATGSASDTFTASGGVLAFNLPSLALTVSATSPVDLGPDAEGDGVRLSSTVTAKLATTLNLGLSFSLDTTHADDFSATLGTLSLKTTASDSGLKPALNFGILGGQVQGGSYSLTAGLGASFVQRTPLSVADLLASQASPSTTVTITPTSDSAASASLPTQFVLNGTSLSGNPMPTVSLADAHPFDGSAPAATLSNFNALAPFGNLSSADVLAGLRKLQDAFTRVGQTGAFSGPVPFVAGKTAGQLLDFGGAFKTSVVDGLNTIPSPSSAPTASPSGGGSSGGLLAPGSYVVVVTYATSHGQSAPGPASSSFSVAAGQVPRVTLPAIPAGYVANLYLSAPGGTAASATLYRAGVTSSTVDLAQAAPAGAAALPTSATSTALFGSIQDLSALLGGELATTPGTPFPVNVRFVPKSATNPDEILFDVAFTRAMPSIHAPVDLGMPLGTLGGISTSSKLLVMPTIAMGLTIGLDLDPSPTSLSGSVPQVPTLIGLPFLDPPANGRLGGDASFTVAIGTNAPVTLSLPDASTASLTTLDDPSNPVNPAALTGQLNLALQAQAFRSGYLGDYVTASLLGGNVVFTLLKYDQGRSLTIGLPNAAANPMATLLGFSDGQAASLPSGSSLPVPSNGRLGSASSFTLTIGSSSYPVAISQSAAASVTSISNPSNPADPSTLVGQLNLALATAGIGAEVAAGYSGGEVSFSLRAFDLGTTLKIDFAQGDPMGTVLGFFGGQSVHARGGDLFITNATASGSLNLAVTNATGAAFGTAGVGPVAVTIGQGTFSSSGTIDLAINGGRPIDLTTLTADLTTASGASGVLAVKHGVAFAANLQGIAIAPGGSFTVALPAPPSATIIALDPLDGLNRFAVADAGLGRIGSDLFFRAQVGSGPMLAVEVPQATTRANTSVAQLVAEISAALLAADPTGSISASIAADQGGFTEIVFAPSASAPAGTTVSASGFVGVQYTNFGPLSGFRGLDLGSVARAVQQAFQALGQYASLGPVGAKLPLVDVSIVGLVDYARALAGPAQALVNAPAATLQAFGDEVASLFGLPANDLTLTYDPTTQALRLRFIELAASLDAYLPMSLDLAKLAAGATSATARAHLQGLGRLVDLEGKSRIHVQAAAAITLDLGMSFANPGAPSAFLYNDTGVVLADLMVVRNSSFNASLGAADLSIRGGSATFSADGIGTSSPAIFGGVLRLRNGVSLWYE